jgi:hypothetical protein
VTKSNERKTADLWRDVRDKMAVIKALSQVDDRDPPSRTEN